MSKPIILVCRPANPNDFPEGPLRDNLNILPPLDPGALEGQCLLCGMTVLMGPRQRTQYELDPNAFVLLDFLCAVRSGAYQTASSVESAGGK